jgi:hypothetical protein
MSDTSSDDRRAGNVTEDSEDNEVSETQEDVESERSWTTGSSGSSEDVAPVEEDEDASDPDDSDYTDHDDEESESEEPDPINGLDSDEEDSEEELDGVDEEGSVDSRATPVAVPPVPEPETKARRDFRELASKVDHFSMHLPKNPYCLACQESKMKQVCSPRSVPKGSSCLGRYCYL